MTLPQQSLGRSSTSWPGQCKAPGNVWDWELCSEGAMAAFINSSFIADVGAADRQANAAHAYKSAAAAL